MAIDNAEKRRSISGIHGVIYGPGVTPESGQDQEWRQESGYSYSGILVGATTPGQDALMHTANSSSGAEWAGGLAGGRAIPGGGL